MKMCVALFFVDLRVEVFRRKKRASGLRKWGVTKIYTQQQSAALVCVCVCVVLALWSFALMLKASSVLGHTVSCTAVCARLCVSLVCACVLSLVLGLEERCIDVESLFHFFFFA